MRLSILGVGTAVPVTRIDQADAAAIASGLCCRTDEHRTWLPAMYQKTGIDHRHLQYDAALIADLTAGTRASGSPYLPTGRDDDRGPTTAFRVADYARAAPVLAENAARAALRSAAVEPGRVTHLVTVSCTGFHAPGFDLDLIARLPLPATVARTHVGFMGCHGALNGLRVARAFAASDPDAVVLVCAVELCSLHYHYGWEPPKMIANALFADGAAAVVGAAPVTNATPGWRLIASGSCVFPGSADAMTWTIGDHGFEMTLSKRVPRLIAEHLRPWLSDWLRSRGVGLDAVGSWALHPGGPRILDAVEQALGLPPEAAAESRAVFAEFGNMSSPTVLFILDRLMRRRAPGPCVALGFGPGLTAEVALFDVA